MREDFISYIWQHKLIAHKNLYTSTGEEVEILHPGTKNYNSGPDFSAAKIRVGKTIWAGNIELHVKASDWKAHFHHEDPAYSNIILHIVYDNDLKHECESKLNPYPCVELKKHISKELINNYQNLINKKSWIACEYSASKVEPIIISSWLNRLLVERLERKSEEILHFLKYYNNNWEEVFYYFLAGNFGFKKNKTPFRMLAQKTPHSLICKHKDMLFQLEALLFGQSGLLNNEFNDIYPKALYKEYLFFKQKYGLKPIEAKLWKYSRLRPANFPGIRISQFAMLLNQSGKLFMELIQTNSLNELREILQVSCSPYWTEHYKFDNNSINRNKNLGEDSINNIVINTVVPFMFLYGKERMHKSLVDKSIELLSLLPGETNNITRKWKETGLDIINAYDSQALIELKKNYCTSKRCLECQIGHRLISKHSILHHET